LLINCSWAASATDLRKVVIIVDFRIIFIIVQQVAVVVSKGSSIRVIDVTVRYQLYRASPLRIHVGDLIEMTGVEHYLRPLEPRARLAGLHLSHHFSNGHQDSMMTRMNETCQ
jgi:hypothetical protein